MIADVPRHDTTIWATKAIQLRSYNNLGKVNTTIMPERSQKCPNAVLQVPVFQGISSNGVAGPTHREAPPAAAPLGQSLYPGSVLSEVASDAICCLWSTVCSRLQAWCKHICLPSSTNPSPFELPRPFQLDALPDETLNEFCQDTNFLSPLHLLRQLNGEDRAANVKELLY